MAARTSEPLRTCVACKRTRPKSEFVRLVVRGDLIVRDTARAQGRGAYVCPEDRCMTRAQAAAPRALRAPGARWAEGGTG